MGAHQAIYFIVALFLLSMVLGCTSVTPEYHSIQFNPTPDKTEWTTITRWEAEA